ncbi:MAG TPA: hypothetical protein VFX25_08970 [Streptosporangiaceae bacterium]|nr:hypothetical protein [Streptosporangiaceae bacterium]
MSQRPDDGGSHAPAPGAAAAPPRAGRRRAAGIYGAIITASIMAAAGDSLRTLALALSVLVTLVVYWLAEQYAELLGEQAAHGHVPTWRHVRGALGASWPIVSASFAPLAALVVARLAGASASDAANVGVGAAIALLTFHGWRAGRAAELRGWRLAATTAIAAILGLVMVALKNLVLLHLH